MEQIGTNRPQGITHLKPEWRAICLEFSRFKKRIGIISNKCTHARTPPCQHFCQQNRSGKAVALRTPLPTWPKMMMLIAWRTLTTKWWGGKIRDIQPFKIQKLDMLKVWREQDISTSDIRVRKMKRLKIPQKIGH